MLQGRGESLEDLGSKQDWVACCEIPKELIENYVIKSDMEIFRLYEEF